MRETTATAETAAPVPAPEPAPARALTLADIEAADDRRVEPVDVPEWGGRVYVRGLSCVERDRLDAQTFDQEGNFVRDRFRVKVVAACLCDADGKPLCKPEHVAVLAGKSDAALARVYDAAARLNRLRKADGDAEKKG